MLLQTAPATFSSPFVVAGLAAGFALQAHVGNCHSFFQRLAHVVNREGGN